MLCRVCRDLLAVYRAMLVFPLTIDLLTGLGPGRDRPWYTRARLYDCLTPVTAKRLPAGWQANDIGGIRQGTRLDCTLLGKI